MSDPALQVGMDASSFMDIENIPREKSAVYLVDFDGVIVSGVEDKIYKLEEREGERELFGIIEERLNLRISDMEFRYRRHLIFQELARIKQIEMKQGAGFSLAKWAAENARFFLLTARSGWIATERVRAFLNSSGLRPIDIYQVGRVHKDRQIVRTVEEFPNADVYYVEDSVPHLVRSAALGLPSLVPVYCSDDVSDSEVEDLYAEVFREATADVL